MSRVESTFDILERSFSWRWVHDHRGAWTWYMHLHDGSTISVSRLASGPIVHNSLGRAAA